MTGENSPEAQLRDKLRKIEALFAGAGTAGEKAAACAASGQCSLGLAAVFGMTPGGQQAPPNLRCQFRYVAFVSFFSSVT
jgi:hypothetical protein